MENDTYTVEPPVFLTKAHIYYELCERPGDRHCEVGKMVGRLRSSRTQSMAKTSKVVYQSGGNMRYRGDCTAVETTLIRCPGCRRR